MPSLPRVEGDLGRRVNRGCESPTASPAMLKRIAIGVSVVMAMFFLVLVIVERVFGIGIVFKR